MPRDFSRRVTEIDCSRVVWDSVLNDDPITRHTELRERFGHHYAFGSLLPPGRDSTRSDDQRASFEQSKYARALEHAQRRQIGWIHEGRRSGLQIANPASEHDNRFDRLRLARILDRVEASHQRSDEQRAAERRADEPVRQCQGHKPPPAPARPHEQKRRPNHQDDDEEGDVAEPERLLRPVDDVGHTLAISGLFTKSATAPTTVCCCARVSSP